MQKDVQITIAVFIAVSCILLAFEAKQESPIINAPANAVISLPTMSFDVLNKNQGTVTIEFDSSMYKELIISQMSKNIRYIILFTSKRIPGLEIRYDLAEKVFEAGVPTFKSVKTDILDGNKHVIEYSYKYGENQELYIDKTLIGLSPYLNPQGNAISGFIIKNTGAPELIESNLVASNIEISDYAKH